MSRNLTVYGGPDRDCRKSSIQKQVRIVQTINRLLCDGKSCKSIPVRVKEGSSFWHLRKTKIKDEIFGGDMTRE